MSEIQVFEDQDESWEDTDELQQRDLDTKTLNETPVRINVDNLVRVRPLPARRMTNNSLTVANDGVPKMLIGRSDQRMSVLISTYGAGIYVSSDPAVQGSYLPNGVGRSYDYCGAIWVTCLLTEPSSTLVSYDAMLTED